MLFDIEPKMRKANFRNEKSLKNSTIIVLIIWNYCNGPGLGLSLARSPACEYAGARKKPRLTLRDDNNEK